MRLEKLPAYIEKTKWFEVKVSRQRRQYLVLMKATLRFNLLTNPHKNLLPPCHCHCHCHCHCTLTFSQIELTRFMYETRGAIRYLATTPEQKEAAAAFNQSIENVYTNNTKKNGEKTMAAAKDAVEKLDAFSALI